MEFKSISEIQSYLAEADWNQLTGRLKDIEGDSRKGVQKLLQTYKRKLEKYHREIGLLIEINTYENKHYNLGKKIIAGLDEVGRGPLAGPVVASAVVLPPDSKIIDINDSKKLSEQKRERLYEEIMEKALAVGIGVIDVETIDEINILQATFRAMGKALEQLNVTPDVLLIDAITIPFVSIPQEPIIKGDTKSISIAAASIIAKVTRDRMMIQLDELYPEYCFAKNKGYGSKEHIDAIKQYGLCPIHRRSFTSNYQ